MRAVVAGSFDPFTLGHLDLVGRASRLFDEVVVAVGINPAKDYLLSFAERFELAQASCRELSGVIVRSMEGLLVDFCQTHDIATIVKGARSGVDFDAELGLAQMNASYAPVETVILPAAPSRGFISSTLVRQLYRGGGDVGSYLPAVVDSYLTRRKNDSDGTTSV